MVTILRSVLLAICRLSLTILLCLTTHLLPRLYAAERIVNVDWKTQLAQISPEDKEVLTAFFKLMLLDSDGGYVLFGAKPICLEGVFMPPSLSEMNFGPRQNPFFDNAETLQQGIEVWNRLPFSRLEGATMIICYDHPDLPVYSCRHLLWINRKAFVDEVIKNINLFQAILGPQVTAEGLFDEITNPKASFFSTLGHNKILIGIVLGFGTPNAIVQNRIELIDGIIYQQERPPLAVRIQRTGFHQKVNAERFLGEGSPLNDRELQPSFGFQNLAAEYESLQDKMRLSRSLINAASPPIPYFACMPTHPTTIALLDRYRETQKQVQRLFDSHTFLEDVLAILMGNAPLHRTSHNLSASLPTQVIPPNKEDAEGSIADRVAHLIWDYLPERDDSFLTAFIAGMETAQQDILDHKNSPLEGLKPPIPPYLTATAISKARKNIAEGNKALNELAKGSDIHTIVPEKLFYTIAKQGSGKRFHRHNTHVTLQYSISQLTGDKAGLVLASTISSELCVSDLIPGLAHGMLTMLPGEVRNIYIHSDYAYGCRSKLEPGVALLATVELVSFRTEPRNSKSAFPLLVPVDSGLTNVIGALDEQEMVQLRKQIAYSQGYNAWSYLGLAEDSYSLPAVIERLRSGNEGGKPVASKDFDPTIHHLFRTLQRRMARYSSLNENQARAITYKPDETHK